MKTLSVLLSALFLGACAGTAVKPDTPTPKPMPPVGNVPLQSLALTANKHMAAINFAGNTQYEAKIFRSATQLQQALKDQSAMRKVSGKVNFNFQDVAAIRVQRSYWDKFKLVKQAPRNYTFCAVSTVPNDGKPRPTPAIRVLPEYYYYAVPKSSRISFCK